MCLIDVSNLKEITTGRLFLCGSKVLQKQCEEEEKCEENWAFFGRVYILFTSNPISFKCDM